MRAQPAFQQAQGVVPQGVDLDRLAAPRRHDPVADLGVHPGQLIACRALSQQAVAGVHADAEVRAPQMMLDDVAAASAAAAEACRGRSVTVEITIEGVEEPERGVGRVIEAFLLALGEHIGDQAVADVVGEGAQDVAGLAVPAGRQRQAFQADHGVAAPVGEPVVAGDDRADLVAGGARAGRILDAAGRRDEELIGRQHKARAGDDCTRRSAPLQQPLAPLVFRGEGLCGRQRVDRFPRFRRSDQGGIRLARQIDAEVARRPERAGVIVAAALLDAVQDVRSASACRW